MKEIYEKKVKYVYEKEDTPIQEILLPLNTIATMITKNKYHWDLLKMCVDDIRLHIKADAKRLFLEQKIKQIKKLEDYDNQLRKESKNKIEKE